MASRSSLLAYLLLVPHIAALKTCQEACTSHNDCEGQLACMSGKCNDDPWVGTHICSQPQPGSLKTCREACTKHDDCEGQLACMSGECNDDPWVGTHICSQSPPASPSCQPSGTLVAPSIPPDKCNTQHMSSCCTSGKSYDKYTCSPPVTQDTEATLTVNGFGQGEDGGGASACPPFQYYSATDRVVALSTGWYNGGSRCGKTIEIKYNGKSSKAKVVDECDSRRGCDEMHAYQPPCKNNIVDASEAVWRDLGVTPGLLQVTWRMV